MNEQFLSWARSEERRNVEIPAIAYRQDGKRLGVVISDLSYDGCQIATEAAIGPGEELTIVIFELGAEVTAVVRWANDGKLGVQFATVSSTDSEALEA